MSMLEFAVALRLSLPFPIGTGMLCHNVCLVFVATRGRTLSPVVGDWQQRPLSVFFFWS